jgi:hypothetical protein
VLLRNLNGIANVVAVAVRTNHYVALLHLFFILWTEGITQPWIDIHNRSVLRFNAEGCMAKPGQPVSLQIHFCLVRN